MKSIKIAGLCLVAILAMSMVVSAAASAEVVWEHCTTGTSGSLPTKYKEHQCEEAAPGNAGEWQWNVVEGTEKVVSHGSLVLKDLKVPIVGTVEVQCTGENTGLVGPKKFDKIETITKIKCTAGKNCEKVTKEAEPRNLVGIGWQTELTEVAGEVRDNLTNGKLGTESPGWAVSCQVLGISKEDVCTTSEGSASVKNETTKTASGLELLVLATFDTKSKKANCTIGGTEAGEVNGTIAILQANGWGLRIS